MKCISSLPSYHIALRRLGCLLSFVIGVATCVCAQGPYKTTEYYRNDLSDYTLIHRGVPDADGKVINKHDTEWRKKIREAHADVPDDEVRQKVFGNDTYDETPFFESDKATSIPYAMQATHTYVDTLYVKKGQQVKLELPVLLGGGSATSAYYRWYSYRTGKNFTVPYGAKEDEEAFELLRPDVKGDYYFKNESGYISGVAIDDHLGIKYSNISNRYMLRAYFYYPTDEEFAKWFKDNPNPDVIDNRWYVVACDLSKDNDEVLFDDANKRLTEPTLGVRVVFYISAADEDDLTDKYQQEGYDKNPYWKFIHDNRGKTGNDDSWFEDYEIDFPYRRISSKAGFRNPGNASESRLGEIVSLSKDGRYWYVPAGNGGSDNWGKDLKVTLVDGTGDKASGITFLGGKTETTVSAGETLDRKIFFEYPSSTVDTDPSSPFYQSQTVLNPNAEATLYVRTADGTVNLARYRLTFSAKTSLLAYPDVKAVEDSTTKEPTLQTFYHYTPKGLREALGVPVVSVNFNLPNDYVLDHNEVEYQGDKLVFYPFPRAWDNSSYGFYDGRWKGLKRTGQKPYWGHYGITSKYIGGEEVSDNNGLPPSGSNYFLFIDASDRPGVITKLDLRDQKLCAGAEMYLSAWVMNGSMASSTAAFCDAGMVFTFIGEKEENGHKVQKPIYRFTPGQIPRTQDMERFKGHPHWMYIYGQYVVPTWVINENFEKYYIRVDNNSFNTQGADFYIDQIQVFVRNAPGAGLQLSPICTDGRAEAAAAKIKLTADYDGLLKHRGLTAVDKSAQATKEVLSFALVDAEKWEAARAAYKKDHPNELQNVPDTCLVPFHFYTSRGDINTESQRSASLSFTNYYDDLVDYATDIEGNGRGNGPDLRSQEKYWLRYTGKQGDNDVRNLAIDILAQLRPGKRYIFLRAVGKTDHFDLNSRCAMFDVFDASANYLVFINGDSGAPDATLCDGQYVRLTARMSVFHKGQTVTYPANKTYFDWYHGSEKAFREDKVAGQTFTLYEALSRLRTHYPYVNSMAGVTPTGDLTQEHIDALIKVLREGTMELCSRMLLVRVGEGTADVVAVPVLLDDKDLQDAIACDDPILMHFSVNGVAPSARLGYYVNGNKDDQGRTLYPEDFDPYVRTSLEALNHKITVPLRTVKITDKDYHYLSPIKDRHDVLLVGTDDNTWTALIAEEAGEGQTVGQLTTLAANADDQTANRLTFTLNADAVGKMKEGYTYTLLIQAAETAGRMDDYDPASGLSNKCFANVVIPVRIVPRYLRWTGAADGNWNNDLNWERPTAAQLNMPTTGAGAYTDYADSPTPGLVPMDHTSVVITEGKEVRIYKPGYLVRAQNIIDPDASAETNPAWQTVPGIPAGHIGLDLALELPAAGADVDNCIPFYTNRVKDILFEPHTALLPVERLAYSRAWVDYSLPFLQWQTVASPFAGEKGENLVAGDFYTALVKTQDGKLHARETAPYFSDLTYGAVAGHSRFAPPFYQRAWDRSEARRLDTVDGQTTSDMLLTGEGVWSGLYNDLSVPYAPGRGGSVKVSEGITDGLEGPVIVRLPKADTEYTYEQLQAVGNDKTQWTSKPTGQQVTLDARKADGASLGRLWTAADGGTKVALLADHPENAGWLLVGNPFMSHLDMKQFLEQNRDVLAQSWWSTETTLGDADFRLPAETTTAYGAEGSVAPLEAFFVKLKDGLSATATPEVTFTPAMQTLAETGSSVQPAPALRIQLLSSADTAAVVTAEARVTSAPGATDSWREGEDVPLFRPYADGATDVYTVSGTMAASVNALHSLERLPLGLVGKAGTQATVTFTGVSAVATDSLRTLKLYDAVTDKAVPVTEGSRATLAVGEAGRYYLLYTADDRLKETLTADGPTIYVVRGTGVVASAPTSGLTSLRVWTVDGRLAASPAVAQGTTTLTLALPQGLYVVRATDSAGRTTTQKVSVE